MIYSALAIHMIAIIIIIIAAENIKAKFAECIQWAIVIFCYFNLTLFEVNLQLVANENSI